MIILIYTSNDDRFIPYLIPGHATVLAFVILLYVTFYDSLYFVYSVGFGMWFNATRNETAVSGSSLHEHLPNTRTSQTIAFKYHTYVQYIDQYHIY